MKINEELERLNQIEPIRQQTQTVGKPVGTGFESLLVQQMDKADPVADPQRLQALADPLRLANINVAAMAGLEEADNSAGGDDQLIESLTNGIASTLEGFDGVAARLKSNAPDALKAAWDALQGMNTEIAGIRQDLGRLAKPNAELESMLNELEVLSVTESFKLNRGDYL